MKFRRTIKAAAILSIAAVGLTACASNGDDAAAEDAKQEVHIMYTAFDEGVAVTYLWKHILEEQGYDVELTLADPGPVYAGVSQGDADLYFASNPHSHRDYVAEYGDGFEFITSWYEPLRHALMVPDYVYADGFETIMDLKGAADQFGGQIIGIESGAGITREAHEAVEFYELDDYELVDSSTAAMLTEFGAAVDNEEYIVATAWNPHWAVGEFNMEFLADPEGIFAHGDTYDVIASEAAQQDEALMAMLAAFEMNDDELFALLAEYRDAEEGDEAAAVDAWLADADHQALVDQWVQAAAG